MSFILVWTFLSQMHIYQAFNPKTKYEITALLFNFDNPFVNWPSAIGYQKRVNLSAFTALIGTKCESCVFITTQKLKA